MKFIGIMATVAGLAMFAPTASSAVTVMFDDFNVDQLVIDAPYPGTVNTSTVGNRTLTVASTFTVGSPIASSKLEVADGSIHLSADDEAQSRVTISYSSVGDINLGPGGYFLFDVGNFNGTPLTASLALANFTATVKDTFGNIGTYPELLNLSFSPILLFSAFSGGVNFDSLSTVTFTIDSTGLAEGVDGKLNSIKIGAVPVPAAGFLLVGAIGGLASLRRKKSA